MSESRVSILDLERAADWLGNYDREAEGHESFVRVEDWIRAEIARREEAAAVRTVCGLRGYPGTGPCVPEAAEGARRRRGGNMKQLHETHTIAGTSTGRTTLKTPNSEERERRLATQTPTTSTTPPCTVQTDMLWRLRPWRHQIPTSDGEPHTVARVTEVRDSPDDVTNLYDVVAVGPGGTDVVWIPTKAGDPRPRVGDVVFVWGPHDWRLTVAVGDVLYRVHTAAEHHAEVAAWVEDLTGDK